MIRNLSTLTKDDNRPFEINTGLAIRSWVGILAKRDTLSKVFVLNMRGKFLMPCSLCATHAGGARRRRASNAVWPIKLDHATGETKRRAGVDAGTRWHFAATTEMMRRLSRPRSSLIVTSRTPWLITVQKTSFRRVLGAMKRAPPRSLRFNNRVLDQSTYLAYTAR